MIGNGHAGFGRAASEKDPQGHLAGVVPRRPATPGPPQPDGQPPGSAKRCSPGNTATAASPPHTTGRAPTPAAAARTRSSVRRRRLAVRQRRRQRVRHLESRARGRPHRHMSPDGRSPRQQSPARPPRPGTTVQFRARKARLIASCDTLISSVRRFRATASSTARTTVGRAPAASRLKDRTSGAPSRSAASSAFRIDPLDTPRRRAS